MGAEESPTKTAWAAQQADWIVTLRVLVTIPHFYQAKGDASYGSEQAYAEKRIVALTSNLCSWHQTFGRRQSHWNQRNKTCNERISFEIDIVVCTTEHFHLVDSLPTAMFHHHPTSAEPRLLGYECHAVLAAKLGTYDYYCFVEDDTSINDPLFFWKLSWFTNTAGEDAVLQPNRYELSQDPPVYKLYIDGLLEDESISSRFQDRTILPGLRGRALGHELEFERPENPHSGCFFLTSSQMQRWTDQPFFLDRSAEFCGPLESAATLGIMRTFRVYKPSPKNAGFLELRHLDNRYLGKNLSYPPGFDLV